MTRKDRLTGFSPFVVTLLMTCFLAISANIENREWTPPFRWPSTGSKTTTVTTPRTSSIYGMKITTKAAQAYSVCPSNCCHCSADKTQIECRGSSLNCQEFHFGHKIRLPTETRVVSLSGFSQLKIYKNALESLTNLKSVTIENVGNVETESFALSQPLCSSGVLSRPTIIINGSSINNLTTRTFTGAWHEITIVNSKLGKIEKESFYQLNCLDKLILDKNNITHIETRTLHGGITNYLKLKSNQIRSIKNNAFDLNVTDTARIHSNHIVDIQSEAFALYSPRNFQFRENTVGTLFTHAFTFKATEKIDINSNSFGKITRHALHKIQAADEAKVTLKLSLKDFDKGAFDLDESLSVTALQLVDIKLDLECDCDLQVRVEALFSGVVVDPSSDGANVRSIIQDSVSCILKNGTEKVYVFSRSHQCQPQGPVQVTGKAPNVVMIASVVCTLLVIFILGIVVVVVTIRKRESKLRRESLETQKTYVMHVYHETECKVEEEYVLPLETLN